MNYGKYKNTCNASWQCLIDYNINSLPVTVTDIINVSDNINLVKNNCVKILQDGINGITIVNDNNFVIIYRDTESPRKCRFTIAHELGHIALGHLTEDSAAYRTFAIQIDTEGSANVFARDLLAPACVLHELQALTASEISQLCNIGLKAATYRADRMKELEHRNTFYMNTLEKQVKKQFKNFINEHKPFHIAM